MNEQQRQQRNAVRLLELYPDFGARVRQLLLQLEAAGMHPRLQDAWRSPAAQRLAYKGGFSKLAFGYHNVTGPDGEPAALAVDILDNDAPAAPSRAFLLQLAAAAEQVGLRSGIRWGLPAALASAIDAAILAQDWTAPVKLGWDPTHVETREVTVAQARAGKRRSDQEETGRA